MPGGGGGGGGGGAAGGGGGGMARGGDAGGASEGLWCGWPCGSTADSGRPRTRVGTMPDRGQSKGRDLQGLFVFLPCIEIQNIFD